MSITLTSHILDCEITAFSKHLEIRYLPTGDVGTLVIRDDFFRSNLYGYEAFKTIVSECFCRKKIWIQKPVYFHHGHCQNEVIAFIALSRLPKVVFSLDTKLHDASYHLKTYAKEAEIRGKQKRPLNFHPLCREPVDAEEFTRIFAHIAEENYFDEFQEFPKSAQEALDFYEGAFDQALSRACDVMESTGDIEEAERVFFECFRKAVSEVFYKETFTREEFNELLMAIGNKTILFFNPKDRGIRHVMLAFLSQTWGSEESKEISIRQVMPQETVRYSKILETILLDLNFLRALSVFLETIPIVIQDID